MPRKGRIRAGHRPHPARDDRRRGSDEVHPAVGLFGLAAGDFGDRRLAEDLAQGGDALGPDAAGLVGLVADFAVEDLDDVEDGISSAGRARV